jgi:glycosyltransferase involved in cell wall biosynthesis
VSFVLKRPTVASKGIVVFTHKELEHLDAPVAPLQLALTGLRDRYLLGVHWGNFRSGVVSPWWADFHLAGEGTVEFDDLRDATRLTLCSRNFTPAVFRDLGLAKRWDVINVARPVPVKRLDDFLHVIREVYDRGRALKVLAVCPGPLDMSDPRAWYSDLYRDYERMFTPQERETFTLLVLRGDGYPFPLSQSAIAELYNLSRVFTLFSDREGESRVVAEALLCGLPVLARTDLVGGGLDYLDRTNSRLFATLPEAADALLDLVDRDVRVDTASLAAELAEEHSVPRLEAAMRELFEQRGLVFEGPMETSDLGRKLPSHFRELPPRLRERWTNDLRSPEAALRYAHMLVDSSPRRRAVAAARAAGARRRTGARARAALAGIAPLRAIWRGLTRR